MSYAMTGGDPFNSPATPHWYPPVPPKSTLTHEAFCHAVRAIACERIMDATQRQKLLDAKLVYGAGSGTYRGVCHYGAWSNGEPQAFIEIAASGEESAVQLAGTTIHETGHVLAGWSAGHDKEWKAACARLGLLNAMAVGHVYTSDSFPPDLWAKIAALGEPSDGTPTFGGRGVVVAPGMRVHGPAACPMGRGVKGGKSFGTGSGRLRLWECECAKPVKVRVASDTFRAVCQVCGQPFHHVVVNGV